MVRLSRKLKTYNQNGTALLLSLLLLLAITIVSVTAMKDTMMDENMSRNVQNDTIAFQAADAANNKTLTLIRQDEVLPQESRTAKLSNSSAPERTFSDINLTNPNDASDPDAPTVPYKSISNHVSVEHVGNTNPRGSCANYDCPLTAHGFTLRSTATVDNTYASSTIIQNTQKEPYLRNPDRSFTSPPQE
jgi:Tfp pilus assembly protein PilX